MRQVTDNEGLFRTVPSGYNGILRQLLMPRCLQLPGSIYFTDSHKGRHFRRPHRQRDSKKNKPEKQLRSLNSHACPDIPRQPLAIAIPVIVPRLCPARQTTVLFRPVRSEGVSPVRHAPSAVRSEGVSLVRHVPSARPVRRSQSGSTRSLGPSGPQESVRSDTFPRPVRSAGVSPVRHAPSAVRSEGVSLVRHVPSARPVRRSQSGPTRSLSRPVRRSQPGPTRSVGLSGPQESVRSDTLPRPVRSAGVSPVRHAPSTRPVRRIQSGPTRSLDPSGPKESAWSDTFPRPVRSAGVSPASLTILASLSPASNVNTSRANHAVIVCGASASQRPLHVGVRLAASDHTGGRHETGDSERHRTNKNILGKDTVQRHVDQTRRTHETGAVQL